MTELTPSRGPRRRRRSFLLAALLSGILLAGAFFMIWPRFIPTAWIEKAVTTVVAGTLDRPMSIGAVRVTRLGHIRLDEVVIWSNMKRTIPLVRWASFDLGVKIVPLFRGKLAVEKATFIQPEIFVPLSEEGRQALDLPLPSGSWVLGLLVGQIEVRQGTVTLMNPDATPRLALRNVNLTSRLESLRGPLRFQVAFSVPDASDRANVELEGTLSLAEGAERLTWGALLGYIQIKVEEFDWEEATTSEELKGALAPLASGLVRQAAVQLTLARRSKEVVDVEGSLTVGAVRWKRPGGQPVELTDAALSLKGQYDVASGAVGLERLHFSIPWMEAEMSGRVERPPEGMAFDGAIQGRLIPEKLPRTAQEALASQGVDIEGPITWEAALNAGPGRTAVSGSIELEAAAVRVAGLALKAPGEPARVAFNLEGASGRLTIHQIELKAPEGETHLTGMVNWEQPQRTSVNLRVTSRASAELLAERWYASQPPSPRAVSVAGDVTAELTVRGLLEGLTLAGTLDATDVLVVIGGMEMKAQGEPATVEATLEYKKHTLLVRHAEVRLPMAAASLRGKLPLQTIRPRYDLKAALHIDVDGLKRRLGQNLLWLPAGVTTSGSLEAKATVARFQETMELDLDVDATALEVHWGPDLSKAAGLPARLRLAGGRLEREMMEFDQLRLDVGPVEMSFAGRVAEDLATASLTYEGSVSDLATLFPLWRPLTTQSLRGGIAVRGNLKWAEGRTALHGSADFHNASLTLAEEPAVTLGLHGTITHSPTSLFTERLLLTVDDQPVALTATVEKKASGLGALFLVDAGRVDLTNLWAHLKPATEAEPAVWRVALATAIKGGAQLHGRVQAEELRIDPYRVTNLAMDITGSEGVIRVPLLDFGLIGGEAHHTLTLDLTGVEPALEATIDWWGLGADPNIRALLDRVFPNLFVTGSMKLSAKGAGSFGNAAKLADTLEGTSTIEVNRGYVVSAPTPQETRQVFPTLTLSHYTFERALIETRRKAGRSRNLIHFEAPTINLFVHGWTDHRTREIDYIVVVDLVDNIGLRPFRDKIPDTLESASRVEIAHITGTIDDRRIAFFRPRVFKIQKTLQSLLGLEALQGFLRSMSAEEKAAYLKGTVGSVLGAATRPFRYLTRRLNLN